MYPTASSQVSPLNPGSGSHFASRLAGYVACGGVLSRLTVSADRAHRAWGFARAWLHFRLMAAYCSRLDAKAGLRLGRMVFDLGLLGVVREDLGLEILRMLGFEGEGLDVPAGEE